MNILVFSQQYWPENWRITDMCEELVKRGHLVTVICGLPNYDTGFLLPEYRHKRNRDQYRKGVHIIRCYERARRKGFVNLFLNYLSFEKSGERIAKRLPSSYDVVFVNQLSPVMQCRGAISYAKKNHKRMLMYCLDLWPESLSAGGIKNRGLTKPIYAIFREISRKIYNCMDMIYVTSPTYIDYLHSVCLVPRDKISFLPQYAEELFSGSLAPGEALFTQHTFVFAGNVGKAQDVETIIRAAALLEDYKDISFHIVGNGSDYQKCICLSSRLKTKNVFFDGRLPLQKMPNIFASAYAMLITLSKEPYASLVLPAKLQAYMAAGKPILGSCNGAVSTLIKEANCGMCVSSGDADALAKSILLFSRLDQTEVSKYSQNAIAYSKSHFNRRSFFDTLEIALAKLSDLE